MTYISVIDAGSVIHRTPPPLPAPPPSTPPCRARGASLQGEPTRAILAETMIEIPDITDVNVVNTTRTTWNRAGTVTVLTVTVHPAKF